MLRLKNQLCFPLYACSKEVIRKYKPYLDEIHLTYTQYITMMVLWEKKNISVKELGEQLYLDSGTLTPLLKKMETQGLVCRERSARDERSVIVTITKQGEQLKSVAQDIPVYMGKCLHLSQDETITLYNLLYKVLGRVTKA